MKNISCVRLLKCDAGHRVLGHEGKCAHPHGHEYRFEIEAQALQLDSIGRLIDFSVIKQLVGGWIDENWDHNFLVYEKDHALLYGFKVAQLPKPVVVVPFNPTAENMAVHLLHVVCPKVLSGRDVVVTRVRVWETQNCYAEAKL